MLGRGKKDHARLLMPTLNKSHLVMCIVIEGPGLKEVNFNQVLDIVKDQNHRIIAS